MNPGYCKIIEQGESENTRMKTTKNVQICGEQKEISTPKRKSHLYRSNNFNHRYHFS